MTPIKNGKDKACETCGILFYVPKWKDITTKYCSGECRGVSQQHDKTRKCEQCNVKFQYKYGNKDQRFCSPQCRTLSLTNRTSKNCKICAVEFFVAPWNIEKTYCSKQCADIGQEVTPLVFICEYCKGEFQRKQYKMKATTGNKFCSVKCICRYNNMTGNSIRKRTNTKPEQFVKVILEELNISFEVGKKIRYKDSYKLYDIFIPALHLLIEVDGIYWHGKGLTRNQMNNTQKHNKKNDMIKNKLAKQHGYNLIRIWEDEISVSKLMEVLCVR